GEGRTAWCTGGGCMPTRGAESIGCDPGRRDGRLGMTVLLALAAVFVLPGCAGPLLLRPARTILDSRPDRQVITPSSPSEPPAKADSAVVRSQAIVPTETVQPPTGPPVEAAAPRPPDESDPVLSAPAEVAAPFPGRSVRAE